MRQGAKQDRPGVSPSCTRHKLEQRQGALTRKGREAQRVEGRTGSSGEPVGQQQEEEGQQGCLGSISRSSSQARDRWMAKWGLRQETGSLGLLTVSSTWGHLCDKEFRRGQGQLQAEPTEVPQHRQRGGRTALAHT